MRGTTRTLRLKVFSFFPVFGFILQALASSIALKTSHYSILKPLDRSTQKFIHGIWIHM